MNYGKKKGRGPSWNARIFHTTLFLVFQEIHSGCCTVAAHASTGERPLPNRLPQPLTTIARSSIASICNPRPVDAYSFICEGLLCGA